MIPMDDSCAGCGQAVPDWPTGWLFLDDRCYCPPCRKRHEWDQECIEFGCAEP